MPQPKQPLDYTVKIPEPFRFKEMPDNYYYEYAGSSYDKRDGDWLRLPIYDDSEQYGEEKVTYTLKEIIDNFEQFVRAIQQIVRTAEKYKFDAAECKEMLAYYYDGEIVDIDFLSPSRDDNYYYAQTMPALRAAEIALYLLQAPEYWNMDITEPRARVDRLKQELWVCLPRFYKAHADPMPQPLTYDKDAPYPYFHVADNFFAGMRPLNSSFVWWDEYRKLSGYLPADDSASRVATLSCRVIPNDSVELKLDTGASMIVDINTYDFFYPRLLGFIEDMVSNNDPAYFYIDPEGWVYDFLCDKASTAGRVKFMVHQYIIGEKGKETRTLMNGVFERKQLVESLIGLCELAYRDSYEVDRESKQDIKRRIEKLRTII